MIINSNNNNNHIILKPVFIDILIGLQQQYLFLYISTNILRIKEIPDHFYKLLCIHN